MTLHPSERLDYLLNNELKIIQSSNVFSFSIDAVLLDKFAYVPIQKGRIIDLCTGNGVIPLILTKRSKAQIVGVEIQEKLYDMAIRSVDINGLSEKITLVHADINDLPKEILTQTFDVVTCNPPYFEAHLSNEQNQNKHLAIARHEIYCTLHDVIRISSKLVKQKGKVSIVHRPERLADIFSEMQNHRIEPKRVQFVHPSAEKEANMVLVEGIKDGSRGVKCIAPIIVYKSDGTYTNEFKAIYYG